MNKSLLGIGLIIISIAAFFMWINPHYGNIKTLNVELADSTAALAQANLLNTKRSALVEQENSFNPSDVTKLQKLLPDTIDSIRFVIDMQGIAARHNLVIQDISIGDNARTSSAVASVGPAGKQYGETQLGFSVTTTYDNLQAFLGDLEKSLRVMEVKSLSFAVDSKNPTIYKINMSVGAFWLNQKPASLTSS